ncbi:MAG: hypothetical protein OXC71_03425 [Chloroflexi bacterium]|nr:hypothetical protein [Chloroflexota bacterium]
MTTDRDRRFGEMARRGKYRSLYAHLCNLATSEWRASFRDIETVLGFALPPSARLHRPWWTNQSPNGGHSQALAWGAAGWETAEVDLEAETLVLRRQRREPVRTLTLDELWPVHRAGTWPEELSLSRADTYDDRA